VDYHPDQRVVNSKSLGEMLLNMPGYHAGQQHRIKRLVAAADVTIAEPVNEITAAQAQRSGVVQDKSAYRVFVFAEARLECWQTHWASIRFCPGRGHIGARSGALVVVQAATS